MPVFLSIFRVTDLLFSNQLWIQHLKRKFHGDIFFQIEYFCGADGKEKMAKIPNFLQRGNSWRPNNVKTRFVSQVLLLKKWNTFNYFSYKENNFSMVFQITHFFTGIDLIVRFFFSSWFRLKGVVSNRNMMWRKMLDFYVVIKTALRDESRQKRECFATKRGK